MVNWLEVVLDTVAVVLSFGLLYYGYRLSKFFKEGIFHRSFEFLVSAAMIFATAEFFHVLEEFTSAGFFDSIHIIFEVLFILLMFHSFGLLHKSWVPIEEHRSKSK
ncbi:MAG: hypothetical protein ACE5I5_20125 [Candidatus Heimdallarchaeota archaeon]